MAKPHDGEAALLAEGIFMLPVTPAPLNSSSLAGRSPLSAARAVSTLQVLSAWLY